MNTSLCRVSILPDNIRHNLRLLAASGKPLMPVIKADAYGHGLFTVADVLAAEGVDHLAVGTVSEGALLRRHGFAGTIVALLGAVYDEELTLAEEENIVPVIHDQASLLRMAEAMKGRNGVPVALKCDTGMARLGFTCADIPAVAESLTALPQLAPLLLLSHLAVADDSTPPSDAFTQAQATALAKAADALRARFPGIRVSLGNSPCLLAFPELAGDLARPGLALYGCNPLEGTPRAVLGEALLPAMEVSAPVLSVHPLAPGQSFGYGRTFTAEKPMTVAIVGMGYADCYRRTPRQGAVMSLHEHLVPVLGRISMQMTCIDVSACPETRPGDSAFVLGRGVSAAMLARSWETIPYEVLCLLGKNR